MAEIKIYFRGCDGASRTKCYKTIEGARKYAIERVGKQGDLTGQGYAVSNDGVATIYVEGCTLNELFGYTPEPTLDGANVSDEFKNAVRASALRNGLNPDEVYSKWRAYCTYCSNGDQSPVWSEFQEWNKLHPVELEYA